MWKQMDISLTGPEFRQLLDLVFIGNWVLNSTRGDDRIDEYDQIESKLFGLCKGGPLSALVDTSTGIALPSPAFCKGGIMEAIAYYEDSIFFDILADELARRDMDYPEITAENRDELAAETDRYLAEFDENGVENLYLAGMD